jgi:hypothetical protein
VLGRLIPGYGVELSPAVTIARAMGAPSVPRWQTRTRSVTACSRLVHSAGAEQLPVPEVSRSLYTGWVPPVGVEPTLGGF